MTTSEVTIIELGARREPGATPIHAGEAPATDEALATNGAPATDEAPATNGAPTTRGSPATPRNLAPHPTFERDSDGDGVPDGWYIDAPRAALRPQFGIDEQIHRTGLWAATASGGGNPQCFGKWGQVVPITGGRHYRVRVVFRCTGIEDLNVNVLIALVWQLPSKTNTQSPNDHLSEFQALPDGWTLAEGTFRAPDACAALDVELYLRFAPAGTVWWDSLEIVEVPAPAPRTATLATVRWRPDAPSTLERNLAQLDDLLDKAGHLGADLVCLPEMLNKAGMNEATYEDVAEALRGPTFQRLARKAAEHAMYVLGCIYERDGDLLFNTAFLVDRQGELAGSYRKVHLYWPEERAGISPGDAFPVFETDLGRVGVIICYDSWFPETARVLGLKGADLLLFPSAGYEEQQVLARAGDNGLYLVASALNSPALIVTPNNQILARTITNGVVAATVDLNNRATSHPNAGGTLNASPGGKLASRHAPSLGMYREIMAAVSSDHTGTHS